MHILISADMEGATGVVLPADVVAGSPRYGRALDSWYGDINAAIEGFADAGATRITVNDAHGDMTNLEASRLANPAGLAAPVGLVTGRHKSLGMMAAIDLGRDGGAGALPPVDAVAMIGYHDAARGAGVMAHTCLSSAVLDVLVDGDPVSEGAFNALVAEEYGVPVVLVTGDDVICRQAERWAPGAQTAPVKTALSRHSALCLPPAATSALIGKAARAGLGGEWGDDAARRGGPAATARSAQARAHTVEVEVDYPVLAERAATIPTVERSGPCTIRYRSASAAEALRTFRVVVIVIDSGRDAGWA